MEKVNKVKIQTTNSSCTKLTLLQVEEMKIKKAYNSICVKCFFVKYIRIKLYFFYRRTDYVRVISYSLTRKGIS